MYYSITGTAQVKENFAVINAYGVGYMVYSSNTSLSKIKNNETVTMYTYLHVKEDIMQLFGFLTEEELSTFKMLINVSGVGPKMALAILSALSPAEFAMSVVTQDAKTITTAHGVGKKLAEKIIIELKDKLKGVELSDITEDVSTQSHVSNDNIPEAINALMVLGYSNIDSRRVVMSVVKDAETLEDIIKLSLKKLSSM